MPKSVHRIFNSCVQGKCLGSDLVNPRLFQLLDLILEALHLLPAIERTTVVISQASYDLSASRLDALGQVAHRLALVELLPQRIHLLADSVRGRAVLVLELGSRCGQGFVGLGKRVALLFRQLLEFFRYSGLDLLLNELGA